MKVDYPSTSRAVMALIEIVANDVREDHLGVAMISVDETLRLGLAQSKSPAEDVRANERHFRILHQSFRIPRNRSLWVKRRSDPSRHDAVGETLSHLAERQLARPNSAEMNSCRLGGPRFTLDRLSDSRSSGSDLVKTHFSCPALRKCICRDEASLSACGK
jgi:hypothetical protein